MKLKKTIVFSAIAILCLLFMSTSSKALETTVVGYDVDYPKRVREGKTFDITITFIYPSSTHIIFGDRSNIWLYTAINDSTLAIDTTRRAIDYDTDLRPDSITFTINTTVRGYKEGDLFKFQIRYKSGVRIYFPLPDYTDEFADYVHTEVYEIIIRSTNLIDFSFASVIIPLLAFATIISFRKIKVRGK